MRVSLRSAIATIVVATAMAGWPGAARADAPDAWITMKTKLALLTADGVTATDVNVDTVDGRVTLHGKVQSEAEKLQAERTAKGIEGVREVSNLLQVVSEAREERVEAADDAIREEVERRLEAGVRGESEISVASVHQGVVLLEGEARTLGDEVAAVRIARGVPGVRRVASEVKSPDRLRDPELVGVTAVVVTERAGAGVRQEPRPAPPDAEAGRGAKREPGAASGSGGSSDARAGTKLSDAWLTTKVKLELMTRDDVPALDINVDSRDGVVTLFGIVGSEPEKQAAATAASRVSGVTRVENGLSVVPGERREVVEARDEELEERAEAALGKRPALAGVDIEVKAGVARLTGTVPGLSDRLAAARAVRAVAGIRSVRDDLKLGGAVERSSR